MSIKLFTSTCWYHDWYCPYWHPHTPGSSTAPPVTRHTDTRHRPAPLDQHCRTRTHQDQLKVAEVQLVCNASRARVRATVAASSTPFDQHARLLSPPLMLFIDEDGHLSTETLCRSPSEIQLSDAPAHSATTTTHCHPQHDGQQPPPCSPSFLPLEPTQIRKWPAELCNHSLPPTASTAS